MREFTSGELKYVNNLKNREFLKTIGVLVIVVIGVVGFRFGLSVALRTRHPYVPVVSGSMRPALQVGDMVIVQGVQTACHIQVDDIIVFHRSTSSRTFIHRVVEKSLEGETWYFKTKGDANPNPDLEEIPEGKVLGKFIGRIPLLGFFLIYTPFVVGVIIIVAIIFVMVKTTSLKRKTETKP